MSKPFFSNFPKATYNGQTITDLTKRFIIQSIISRNGTIYYDYEIKDGDRPDIVANLYYQDSQLDWVVLMTNNILDPFFDWPLDSNSFRLFLINKYGSVENSNRQVHHYEEIVFPRTVLIDGTIIPERVVFIDETAYNSITEENRRRLVSAYDYENNLNESRRNIKIIHPKFIPQILKEAQKIFAN